MAISINSYNPMRAAVTPRVGRNEPGPHQVQRRGEDTVTISHAAQAAYRSTPQPVTDHKVALRSRIDNDPEFAARMARSTAYGTDLLAIEPDSLKPGRSARFLDGTPTSNITYREQYQELIGKVREKRIEFYEGEKAKGTPPKQLYEKLEAFNQALPEPYRRAVGFLNKT
ncbi:hypothetical protein BOW53_09230 [Solemya pervernicosa gill symbiont]|uniref:Uncharacterized protein n=2 Tax=Gammaproteobacteria incertae sedis TaxID=118884 RepID=A0A1T2L4J1_9GAMM|nr:hypothetical protein [Candidatus Reidiella endopervernicosa]OOZ40009.1 hypothetical protein BOW53_09230 [Solemya pervernicosa gill symbiont]QKQ25292.1 hypothetical protein HUE57_02540 [Candidatus Reidiella endopervernicosa]